MNSELITDNIILKKTVELRHRLHECPELSEKEIRTKKLLADWLHDNTTLEIHELEGGFYAAHRETEAKRSLALRADYDALARSDGSTAHLCGHDGHAAGLCGLALWLEGKTVGKNIFLIFQSGEETGTGAEKCCGIFRLEHIDEIYGLHNLPGFEFGRVFTKAGTFACASRGMTIKLDGKPAHAAYPENGISPAQAVGKILCRLPAIGEERVYTGMVLCTVIGVGMGEKAFGAAADRAEIWLTLRGEHDHDIDLLQRKIIDYAEECAACDSLGFSYALQDVFPSTENDSVCAAQVLKSCNGSILKNPMRWSEDFGHYLKTVKGAFFGIGAGEDHAPLHTENYEYPDDLLEKSIESFIRIIL